MEDPYIIRSFKCSNKPLLSLSFSDKHLATGGEDGQILIWNLKKLLSPIKLIGHTSDINCLDFHTNNKNLVSCSNDSSIKIWDIESDGLYNNILNHTLRVNSVNFHPKENLILSGSDDGNIILSYYNLNENFSKKLILEENDYPINCSKFSNDGKICVYGNSISETNILDIESQTNLFKYSKLNVKNNNQENSLISNTTLNFHPDDNCIFLGFSNGSLELIDLRIQNKIWEIFPIENKINNISCCNDGSSILISGFSPYIKLIDLRNGKLLNNFMAHPDGGSIESFNKKGSYFATGGKEGNCLIWKNIYNKIDENYIEQKVINNNISNNIDLENTNNTLKEKNNIKFKLSDKLENKWKKIQDLLINLNSKINLINQRIENNSIQLDNIENQW